MGDALLLRANMASMQEIDGKARGGLSWRVLLLTLAIACISVLHYTTDPARAIWHGVYQRLYYAPILLAAAWYGARGGLLAALGTALAYVPHIRLAWINNPAYAHSQYVEVVMFFAAGLLVGLLFDTARSLANRYRSAAELLEQANRELRESHEQLRRADRLSALGQIAAGLAHEIRNPLGGLKGALEIIESRVRPGTPEAEFAQLGRREAARLEGLVSEFLDYARPRAPQLEPVELRSLIEHVTVILRPQAERLGTSIDFEAGEDGLALRGDAQQLEQVFVNVVLNAIQASPRGGLVRIRASTTDHDATVDVIDEGPGIPPDQLGHVFDPFFTTKDKGTGLGLAISARIIAAHGGEILVVARDVPGTQMRVRLPRSGLATGRGGADAESRS